MSQLHDKKTLQLIDAIHDHLDLFIEEDELLIFHQADDKYPHIDVYWIKPNEEYRPFTILLTSGLSIEPLKVPDAEYDKYLEVAMLLPADWQLGAAGGNKEENDWPIHHLRSIALTPYSSETWVGAGHTFEFDAENKKCFPGTGFNATMMVESISLPKKFLEFKVGRKKVKILTTVPLYPEELEFKLATDSYELLSRFNEFNISEFVDINRPNTCLK